MPRVFSDKNDPFKKFNKLYEVAANGCWEWTGTIHPKYGYGYQRFNRKKWRVHRYSYLIHKGEFDQRLCVLHRCDNRKCVNPAHLFLGNRKENMADCIKKGRKPRGEECSFAKLSLADVTMAKKLRADGWLQREIADKFGVNRATITRVLNKSNWAHA